MKKGKVPVTGKWKNILHYLLKQSKDQERKAEEPKPLVGVKRGSKNGGLFRKVDNSGPVTSVHSRIFADEGNNLFHIEVMLLTYRLQLCSIRQF